ncbi:beta-1,3-galactosyltransferase brn-like [Saccostrea echinata]|uniref:beta-1,3-galactosyltransferase brn-like n=1 Tax=Saccostrea echinata TaxID=191078 RepID=UPI002A7EDBC9|nr:beta-1,3-galactosyltransferase brn-like [Saccostrea echinata]
MRSCVRFLTWRRCRNCRNCHSPCLLLTIPLFLWIFFRQQRTPVITVFAHISSIETENLHKYSYSNNFPRKGCPLSLNTSHLQNVQDYNGYTVNRVLFQCAPPLNISNIRKKKLAFMPLLYPLELDIVQLVKTQLEGKKIVNEPINLHNFNYIHQGQNICKESNIFLILVVKSRVENFLNRHVIRKTWGNISNYEAVKIVFLLGFNRSVQRRVDTEALKYRDIVQEDFLDNYSNNTLKTIMGLNWVSHHCRNAQLSFYVDDDVFLIVNNFKKFRKSRNQGPEMMLGKLLSHSVPYRDNTSKWFVSWEDYPFDKYPKYLAGYAYLMSALVVKKFALAIPYIQTISIDDTYLGIVAEKLKIVRKNQPGFLMKKPGPVSNNAVTMNFRNTLAYHQISSPESMMQTWIEYCRESKFCSPTLA